MKRARLLFGIHMHQPVDNFSEAVDEAIEKCYRPFFKVLKDFSKIKLAVHCSGWLLEYIEKRDNKLFLDMKKLAKKGVIEFFTAGFYEPILCSIPKRDRVEQIEKLTKKIKKSFSQIPKGAWLTERVWEDSIVESLVKAGVEYVMVDDYHFLASGFDKDELQGYFYTEDGSCKVALFPINKELRYALPFKDVKEAIRDIKECKNAIIFDDAEKFGLWPKTFEWVYEEGWLEEFFKAIEDDSEIECVHFKEFYESEKPQGLAYLQNLSYSEMGEWSLRTKDALEFKKIEEECEKRYKDTQKFVKGGNWKNFFIKYEESNRLHKRMLEVSRDGLNEKRYKEMLFKLQTNDVFWHGVFGGVYLPNLRDNAYNYLCKCEEMRYKDKEVIEVKDIDLNGYEEVKVVKKGYIVRFDSHFGGQMVEFLQRDSSFNYQSTLTRREESYHKKLLDKSTQESHKGDEEIKSIHDMQTEVSDEVREALSFDWYIKNSFIDHISDESFNLESFKKCSFWEYGDFANQPFELEVEDEDIIFKRDGGIYFEDRYETKISKRYRCKKDKIVFDIALKSVAKKEYMYALEFNLHFANLKDLFCFGDSAQKEVEKRGIKEFALKDSYTKKEIRFSVDREFDLFMTPLKSVSQSEKGFDLTTQGVSFALAFRFKNELNIEGIMEVVDV